MKKIAYLTPSDIEDLIQEVNFPCEDKEGLKDTLNYRVFSISNVWKKKQPNKAQKAKGRRNEIQKLDEIAEEYSDAISKVDSLLQYYKEGISQSEKVSLTLRELESLFLKDVEERSNLENLMASFEGNSSTTQPITNLLRKILPEIYEEYFDREWGATRHVSSGKAQGPAIRFAEFILNKLEIDKASETIYRARSKLK